MKCDRSFKLTTQGVTDLRDDDHDDSDDDHVVSMMMITTSTQPSHIIKGRLKKRGSLSKILLPGRGGGESADILETI